MKNLFKTVSTIALFLALFTLAQPVSADGPPPPPPGGGHGGGGNQPPGGGAPIGGGLGILIALGIAYASKKIYQYKKEDLPVK